MTAMTAREAFVRCAHEQVGRRYQWGAAGPGAFDCSGLVAYCWQRATGEAITRSSCGQIHLGTPLIGPQAQPGDLAFWGHDPACPAHVGIHVGEGRIVNALNEQRGVVNTPLAGAYDLPFIGVRRLFGADGAPLTLRSAAPARPAPDAPEPGEQTPAKPPRQRRERTRGRGRLLRRMLDTIQRRRVRG